MIKKAAADSKTKERNMDIHDRHAWLIAIRERMLEFYSD